MKKLPLAFLISSTLALGACGDQTVQQWWDPDKTFGLFEQPEVKGVNDTQEDMAKEAATAGDYGRAAQFYQQLLATGKGTPEQTLRYKLGMADATRRLGKNDAALAMFEELYREHPKNVDVMEGRGLTLMATGKSSDAGRAFQEVIDRDPKRWRTLNALGILFTSKNMVPEAMAYYGEALTHSPDNAAVLNNVGLSQATDRNFPRAIEALEQAARVSKIPSQKKQIELNLAMVYGVSGDLEKAREVGSKHLEGPALDNNLGLYAHLAKDDNLAKTYLNMALSQSPTFYERAWENLDVINDLGRGEGSKAEGVKTTVAPKLPKIEKLDTAPEMKKEAPRTGKGKKGKAEEKPAAEEIEPAISVPLSQSPGPLVPAPTSPDPIKSDTKSNKPAGLIVGPSEGD